MQQAILTQATSHLQIRFQDMIHYIATQNALFNVFAIGISLQYETMRVADILLPNFAGLHTDPQVMHWGPKKLPRQPHAGRGPPVN